MDDLVAWQEAERQRRATGGGSLLPPAPGAAESEPASVLSDDVLAAVLADQALAFREPLNETCAAFDITTPLRVAHFLAQTAHESAGYTALVENLNYGAPGLLATWPKRFDAERAAAYARQPEKIANYVYADRMGNGPESSGDGWRFRGRGILQLTGRATYRAAGEMLATDLEVQPELLATPRLAALAAGWYWQARGINELCDRDDVIAVTEAVNGGRNGLAQRVELLGVAKAAMQMGDVKA
jgi:putative chitinase